VEAYSARDSRFRLVRQENSGPGVARNMGLSATTGEFFTFVDADDLLHVETLERLVDLASRHQVDLVMCGFQSFSASCPVQDARSDDAISTAVYSAPLLPRLLDWRWCRVHPWGKLYRRSRFGDLRFPGFFGSEDTHYHLDVFRAAQSLVVTDEKLYLYRESENTLTRNSSRHRHYVAGSENVALHCEELCQTDDVPASLAAKLQMIYGTNRIFIELADMAGDQQLNDAQRRELLDMACRAVNRIAREVAGRHRIVAWQHMLTYWVAIRLRSLWLLKRVSALRRWLIQTLRAGSGKRVS
jgi:glycosyltransferase involved in cell wall biosynthesis